MKKVCTRTGEAVENDSWNLIWSQSHCSPAPISFSGMTNVACDWLPGPGGDVVISLSLFGMAAVLSGHIQLPVQWNCAKYYIKVNSAVMLEFI